MVKQSFMEDIRFSDENTEMKNERKI